MKFFEAVTWDRILLRCEGGSMIKNAALHALRVIYSTVDSCY